MRTMQLSVLKRLDNLVAAARSRAAAAPGASSAITAGNGGVAAGALTGTTTALIPVAAFDVTPTRGGLYQVSMNLEFVLSAADSVTWAVLAVPAVTAISGGAQVPPSTGKFHYETTGSPLVVTGGTPVSASTVSQQFAAGQIAACNQSIFALVQLLDTPTRQAIVVEVETSGGAHLTTLNITNASAIEL